MEHAIILGSGLVVGVVLFVLGLFLFMAGEQSDTPTNSGKYAGAGCMVMVVGALMALACLVRGGVLLARAFGL